MRRRIASEAVPLEFALHALVGPISRGTRVKLLERMEGGRPLEDRADNWRASVAGRRTGAALAPREFSVQGNPIRFIELKQLAGPHY